jgi:hypothetical protein
LYPYQQHRYPPPLYPTVNVNILVLDMVPVNMQNRSMDYVYFILVILVMVAVFIFLMRLDKKAKNSYKTDAYDLLEMDSADPKHLKNCIRGLRLYSGRIKKDKEATELVRRLIDKHGHVLD